jgi:histidinol-phosphate aminotransferase
MNSKPSITDLLRTNIKNIKPYSTARDEYSGIALVNLDANENSYGSIDGSNNHRYPDPYQSQLKQIISEIKQIPQNQIFLGNGSDEGIDLLYTAFCNPGVDNAIICPPTYGMYKVSADTNDVQCIEVSLTQDFQLDVAAILAYVNKNTKLIWLCSPNNPTGNLLKREDILTILQNFNGIVVIDEAYIDFASEKSWISEIELFPNLVVLQTFSKAWGLANIRLGMMFASAEIIAVINKIKLPYNISGLVQEYALQILTAHTSKKDEMVQEILVERAKLAKDILLIPGVHSVYPSDANFILVTMDNAHEAYTYLVEKGIIVRDRSKIKLCENSLRITVGTAQENKFLLITLTQFYSL